MNIIKTNILPGKGLGVSQNDQQRIISLVNFARNNGEEAFSNFPPYCDLKTKPKVSIGISLTLIEGLKAMYFDKDVIF